MVILWWWLPPCDNFSEKPRRTKQSPQEKGFSCLPSQQWAERSASPAVLPVFFPTVLLPGKKKKDKIVSISSWNRAGNHAVEIIRREKMESRVKRCWYINKVKERTGNFAVQTTGGLDVDIYMCLYRTFPLSVHALSSGIKHGPRKYGDGLSCTWICWAKTETNCFLPWCTTYESLPVYRTHPFCLCGNCRVLRVEGSLTLAVWNGPFSVMEEIVERHRKAFTCVVWKRENNSCSVSRHTSGFLAWILCIIEYSILSWNAGWVQLSEI